MNNPTLDANIPTLTEIIPPPAAGVVTAESDLTAKAAAATPNVEKASAETSVYTLTKYERSELEDVLNERVLRQVQGRIDFVLEHRVRDSLADALQTSIEALTSEIKRGLHQTLAEVIARAIAQELARLQGSKK